MNTPTDPVSVAPSRDATIIYIDKRTFQRIKEEIHPEDRFPATGVVDGTGIILYSPIGNQIQIRTRL